MGLGLIQAFQVLSKVPMVVESTSHTGSQTDPIQSNIHYQDRIVEVEKIVEKIIEKEKIVEVEKIV